MTRSLRRALGAVLALAPTGAALPLRAQPPARASSAPQGSATRQPATSTSTRISRTRLQQVLGGSTLRVVRASGVSEVAPSAAEVTVRPGEFVFRKMSDTARRIVRGASALGPTGVPDVRPAPSPSPTVGVSGAATYTMPYRWMTVDSSGVERVLVPYFVILGGGLSYDVASRMYRGLALIGVEDTLHPSADPVVLARPLRMQLAAVSGGRISPAQIAIAHTSLDYDSVRIEAPDSTYVRIRTGADPAGIVIPIPVLGLTVGLTPQQSRLQGFGLATTDIGVALPRGMARTDTATVSFSSSGSPVNPNRVRVSGAEGATVRVRSGLPDTNVIRAFIDGVEVGQTRVVSETPISFLAATLLGILLGGAARFVGGKRRKRVRSLPWDILRGAPFGLLASVASAVGLDLAQLKIGEPGALPAIMVTAAIGAWIGARLLERGGAPAPARAQESRASPFRRG